MCYKSATSDSSTAAAAANEDGILIATPGVQDGHINITSLPAESRVATIPTPKDVKTGMIMAIGLAYHDNALKVCAGYESGHVALWQQNPTTKYWQTIYVKKDHTQPVLSLDISTSMNFFFTSSADAIIARHPLVEDGGDMKTVQTKHAGQQSLSIRSDAKIFATAGWDGRARVYGSKSMKEMAVLKWHKEGSYALAFAQVYDRTTEEEVESSSTELVKRELTVAERRTANAKSTHWLAVGSKDGKVSLWDIY
jgi:WD40 repeat protein